MSLVISDKVLSSTRMSQEELRREIAVMLFEKDKLTLGQASDFAGMSVRSFLHLLASREIPIHYDVAEFQEDLETLRRLGQL